MDELKEAISKLNHDLRNSLSVVYSNSQLLELLTEKSNKETHETAQQLSQSIQDMEALLAERVQKIRETL
ncbi:MAG TPA: histidine kinase [Candidatus Paceibacterota bacterium]|nr:histidine kinase [Candidatus Paceibacterota bacterium]